MKYAKSKPKRRRVAESPAAGFLLDTCTLVWWSSQSANLPAQARHAIESSALPVFVSAISAWEVASKVARGKFPEAAPIADRFSDYLLDQAFEELPLTVSAGVRAARLDIRNRDPFDRMLIAQAIDRNLALVTPEEFGQYGVRVVW